MPKRTCSRSSRHRVSTNLRAADLTTGGADTSPGTPHTATTYDGTWLRIYIDGRAAGAKRVSGRTCVSGEPLAVGAKNNPTKGLLEAFWDGRLDEVRIYGRSLTATEIGQLAARP